MSQISTKGTETLSIHPLFFQHHHVWPKYRIVSRYLSLPRMNMLKWRCRIVKPNNPLIAKMALSLSGLVTRWSINSRSCVGRYPVRYQMVSGTSSIKKSQYLQGCVHPKWFSTFLPFKNISCPLGGGFPKPNDELQGFVVTSDFVAPTFHVNPSYQLPFKAHGTKWNSHGESRQMES